MKRLIAITTLILGSLLSLPEKANAQYFPPATYYYQVSHYGYPSPSYYAAPGYSYYGYPSYSYYGDPRYFSAPNYYFYSSPYYYGTAISGGRPFYR